MRVRPEGVRQGEERQGRAFRHGQAFWWITIQWSTFQWITFHHSAETIPSPGPRPEPKKKGAPFPSDRTEGTLPRVSVRLDQAQAFCDAAMAPALRPFTKQSSTAQAPMRTAP